MYIHTGFEKLNLYTCKYLSIYMCVCVCVCIHMYAYVHGYKYQFTAAVGEIFENKIF